MGNVAPHGLWARHGNSWKVPTAISARDAGTWKKVAFVWAYKDGAWKLIWGSAPVAPASVTAAWLKPHSVRITVTPAATNTSAFWIVKRSDGSIVNTVPVSTTVIDDPTPLLASTTAGNKTIGAYTVEGSDGETSSSTVSTNTVTYNLDPASITTSASYPNATTASIDIDWTPNATYGDPDYWGIWRSDGTWITTSLAGDGVGADTPGQARGVQLGFRAIPMALNTAGATVQAGNATTSTVNSKATTPVSLSLTAPTSPIETLRLTWASGGGTVTAYEVEVSTNGTSWTAHTDDTSPSDWSTAVKGWMRVRATSGGR